MYRVSITIVFSITFTYLECEYACVFSGMNAWMRSLKDNFQEMVLSYHVGSRD